MIQAKPITIVGGGLAGLTLGIGLRRRGVPIVIYEAGSYPRHRVCGEFINGRGQEALVRLGLREALLEAGAIEARTARFFIANRASPVRALSLPALCLPRYALDATLAGMFQALGGELRTGTRWRERMDAEGLVRASGRQLRPVDRGCRWFGLKAHARGVPLSADLEIHGLRDAYVGLCHVNPAEVNVCGVFRRSGSEPHAGEGWRETLRGNPGSSLRERLSGAVFDEASFCSVAGLSLSPRRAAGRSECCIGDAITMTPPVTGNGMSMAFEAAEMAVEPLCQYSHGRSSWNEARGVVAEECDRTFATRLRWARRLQWLMFSPLPRGPAGPLFLGSEWVWRWFYARTR